MNKLKLQPSLVYQANTDSVVSTFPPVSANTSVGMARRLVVLLAAEADYTAVMHRVWDLAHAAECQVLFLSLCSDATKEASLRRQLITLCAMAQNDRIHAEGRIEAGSNWIRAIQSNVRDGDMIVCFDEQSTGLRRRPLSQVLESRMGTPVYILAGLSPQAQTSSNWLSRIAAWTGLIAIVAGAFLLQIQIVTLTVGWLQTGLMIGSVLAELWMIWICNRLFK
jgi:hypothetical protein